jgi:hypothetical protein
MPLDLPRGPVVANETATMIRRGREGEVIVRSGPVTQVGISSMVVPQEVSPAATSWTTLKSRFRLSPARRARPC